MDSTDGVIGIAGGRELVDFERLLDRMSERYPTIPRSEIHAVAIIEHDAITGGELYAVPVELEQGLTEALDRHDGAESAPTSAAEPALGRAPTTRRARRDPERSRHHPGSTATSGVIAERKALP